MMQLSDLIVEVRDKTLERIGQIRPEDLDLTVHLRYNEVGDWSLGLADEHPMSEHLKTPGSGLVVSYKGATLFSGPMLHHERKSGHDDILGYTVFTGADDNIHMYDRLCQPDPSNPDPTTQTLTHDVRTGSAESLMHEYVNFHAGPGAVISRRVNGLTLGANLGRGPTLTKRARFTELATLLKQLGDTNGLGFTVTQVGDGIVFNTYAVADKTATIRLDVRNGTLDSDSVKVGGSSATRVVVAGQGEMLDRMFVARTTPESLQSEVDWGRRIERWLDQRQAPEQEELEEAGDELLAAEGSPYFEVKGIPADDNFMEFGVDWFLGDRVTVVIEDDEFDDVATAMVLMADKEGMRIGVKIGSNETERAERSNLANRVGELERNSEAVESAPVIPTFNNNWRNYAIFNEAYEHLKVHVGANSIVTINGVVDGTDATSAGIATIPEKYRPTGIIITRCAVENGDVRVDINPNGTIVLGASDGGHRSWLAINVTYKATQ